MKYLLLFGALMTMNLSSSVAQTKTTKSDTCRVLVSFFSPGSGPNAEAHSKFKAYVEEYNQMHTTKINTGETPWGREGEVDYCMTLKGLNKTQRKKFVSGLKNTLKNQEHVSIQEFKPNIHKH